MLTLAMHHPSQQAKFHIYQTFKQVMIRAISYHEFNKKETSVIVYEKDF